jgi:hypothetical protein
VSNLVLQPLADDEEARLAVGTADADVVGLHEVLLGRPLAAVARRFRAAASLGDSLGDRLLRCLNRGEGRVLATSLGLAGDSGLGGPQWYLLLRGQARQRLLTSEKTYRELCRSRRVRRSVPAHTIAGSELWMGYCVGLDNCTTLPPFFPYGRNEDGVFISTALACDRSAFVGHVPGSILHMPSGPRSYAAEDISTGFSRLRFCDFLSGLLASAPLPFPSDDRAREMRRLGAWLVDVANDEVAFGEVATTGCWRLQDSRLRRLEETLDEAEGPMSWRRDVESQIAALRHALESPTFPCICDLDSSTQVRSGLDEARVAVRNYGRLLHHWPDVVAANHRLMERPPAEPKE